MTTFQDLCNACEALNDYGQNGNPLRWSMPTRLRYAIQAVDKLRRERSDLFLGKHLEDFSSLTLASEVPVESRYHPAIIDWITGKCLTHNNDVGAEGSSAMAHLTMAAGDIK